MRVVVGAATALFEVGGEMTAYVGGSDRRIRLMWVIGCCFGLFFPSWLVFRLCLR